MFTILTIDDEENIRNGLADNFELEGYNVAKAASGKEGLAIIAKGGIDLVITDLRMDGMTGEEVVRRVTTEYPGIPIIVLTGHGSIDDATKAIKLYCDLISGAVLDGIQAELKAAGVDVGAAVETPAEEVKA